MIKSRFMPYTLTLLLALSFGATAKADNHESKPPEGFKSLFNGKDLAGWHGLGHFDPRKLRSMSPKERKAKLEKDNANMRQHWSVKDGVIVNDGHGVFLTTDEEYGDFELHLEWKMLKECGDSGIYLRNTPQVQIWDPNCARDEKHGAQKGSGALWNNNGRGIKGKWPLAKADKPVGEWNKFRIRMIGENVTIWFNGQKVVDGAPLENYFDRKSPVFPVGNIQLQTHGSEMHFRNIFIKRIHRDAPESGKLHKGQPVGKNWKKPLADSSLKADGVWSLNDGVLTGKADNKKPHYFVIPGSHQNFEMHAMVKLTGDKNNAGLCFRATPQSNGNVKGYELDMGVGKHWGLLQQIGGEGTASSQGHEDAMSALKKDDWNHFYVIANGDHIQAWLNGKQVVDVLNPRGFDAGQVALQIFRGEVQYKDIFVRDLEHAPHIAFASPAAGSDKKDGFNYVYNGKDLSGWTGNVNGYAADGDKIVCLKKGGGNLYIDKEYSDFHFRFEFKVLGGANNGLGIRCEKGKDAAYHGMELQILDNTAPGYANLKPYQYHGSPYGVYPALRGHQKGLGQWNYQEVIAKGNDLKVILNGQTIVDINLKEVAGNGTKDGRPHPGLFNKSGYIGFLGHGHRIEFRNIRVKELK